MPSLISRAGGFKYFQFFKKCLLLFGEMIQFDEHIFQLGCAVKSSEGCKLQG